MKLTTLLLALLISACSSTPRSTAIEHGTITNLFYKNVKEVDLTKTLVATLSGGAIGYQFGGENGKKVNAIAGSAITGYLTAKHTAKTVKRYYYEVSLNLGGKTHIPVGQHLYKKGNKVSIILKSDDTLEVLLIL